MSHDLHDAHHPFHVMAKVTGPLCNLACSYCFYLEKDLLYPGEKQWQMPLEVLESFIRQRIASEPSQSVQFAWQGGEPTILEVAYFEKVIELEQRYAGGKTIENALQTNGTLLDDEWCAFLARNRFLVGISIDGPRTLHDTYRRDKGGHGSFDQTVRGLDLLKKHKVDFNTLTVVNRRNAEYPLDVYKFLRDAGSRFMQFIPLVERAKDRPANPPLSERPPMAGSQATGTESSVTGLQFGEFLCTIFDEWVRHDVGEVFVQIFDVALESWIGMPQSLCVYRETCGDALVVEHNGDLYACDHFVEPEYLLGNMRDERLDVLASSASQQAFGRNKLLGLPGYCHACAVRFACNGECPKNRFVNTPDGESGLNYLCEGYKKFFHHIDPAMRFMAEELRNARAPAGVMQWTRDLDAMRHKRNEPCYCGSGRKYKQCHGK